MSKKEELEKYLKQEIHPVFEELVTELLVKVPRGADLIPFCVQWLQNKLPKNVTKSSRSIGNRT
jgi:hypothetical protein